VGRGGRGRRVSVSGVLVGGKRGGGGDKQGIREGGRRAGVTSTLDCSGTRKAIIIRKINGMSPVSKSVKIRAEVAGVGGEGRDGNTRTP